MMAIREKARALFKSKSKSDRDSQISKSSTKDSDRERWPSNVYKPGEPMPRPKYRAIPKKEHKEKLEAFSFADAWRRKSFQSQHSPMGTRAPSRRNSSRRHSWYGMGKKSFGGMSEHGRASRANSVSSNAETEKGSTRQREHVGHAAVATRLSTEIEQEGDDDVGNVGISRVQSRDQSHKGRPKNLELPNAQQAGSIEKALETAHDHQPFTEHDLALALSRSHLAVPATS
ncbi:uncharacterized protein RCC_09270 [Ramularia collo-cygni]|uniref:Uncharacterized protein n=1 Tax=Ramularia collo-cygni TaxID=112498 RepID=A0A2D3V2G4_9PEZI|nr:uncharacterized protein RCC_09270 [Ramularia collo-cygni]CZT23556.1 uncharacterized protein RCC_09270 [Ramularia collo-cygni]